ncbi:MAG: tRNA pseudouridine(38-40) synthase TruA [Lachnospiraceae bacterium]|nr:tRNA pseudouridine(38-40) synthase TruA [Lachnospiraceae bacterium]
MRRIRLKVAYDGTAYHGWQIQKNQITIEGKLNEAISNLLSAEINVIGASRTDAGVHAMGNVAVFDCDSKIPAEKFAGAINARLPEDIRVLKSDEVDENWHPRKLGCRKTYEYRISTGKVQLPTKRLYSHFTYHSLNVTAMQKACDAFLGEHDFSAFCAAGSQAESMIRTIYDLEVIASGTNDRSGENEGPCEKASKSEDFILTEGEVVIRVTGNGFLYNMVRIIAGTLMDVGCGKKHPEDIPDVLKSLDRRKAGPTLPACGLMLIGYRYDCDF